MHYYHCYNSRLTNMNGYCMVKNEDNSVHWAKIKDRKIKQGTQISTVFLCMTSSIIIHTLMYIHKTRHSEINTSQMFLTNNLNMIPHGQDSLPNALRVTFIIAKRKHALNTSKRL